MRLFMSKHKADPGSRVRGGDFDLRTTKSKFEASVVATLAAISIGTLIQADRGNPDPVPGQHAPVRTDKPSVIDAKILVQDLARDVTPVGMPPVAETTQAVHRQRQE
jgi:hypothetical protein